MHNLKKFIKSHPALHSSLTPLVKIARQTRVPRSLRLHNAMAELFQAVEGGSLVLRLDEFGGSFEIDARSHILRRIMTEAEYEPEVLELLKRAVDRSRDAIDVGANAGLFTVFLSKLLSDSARVLAIEPTPGALRYLQTNIQRNGVAEKVSVFHGAATRTNGDIEIHVIPGKEEYSSIGQIVHRAVSDEHFSTVTAAGETLDNLVERFKLKPGLIKIDTEGHEHNVLLGSERTIEVHRPMILCESWDEQTLANSGATPGAVAAFLQSHNYVVSEATEGEIFAVPR